MSQQRLMRRYTPDEDNLIFTKVQEAKLMNLDLSAIYISLAEELGGERSDNGVKQRYGRLNRLYKKGDWTPDQQEQLSLEDEKDNKRTETGEPSNIEIVPEQVNEPETVKVETAQICDTLYERIKFLEEQVAFYRDLGEQVDFYKKERDFYKNERDFYKYELDSHKAESEKIRESMKKLLDH